MAPVSEATEKACLIQNMQEAPVQLGDFSWVRCWTRGNGRISTAELSQREIFVEEKVVELLYGIAEVETPNHPKTEETAY